MTERRGSAARPRPAWAFGLGLLVFGPALLGTSNLAVAAPAKELGIWYDDSGKGAVEIVACGDRLCGRIVWLSAPLNDQGEPKTDRLNPKPDNRTRPICGLQVIGGLQRLDDGGWDSGWIYDPKQGSAFDLAIALIAKDQLRITGYKGVKLFSKTFMWTRAPADLPRCDADAGQQTALPPQTKTPAAKPSQAKPAANKPVATTVPASQPAKRPVLPAEAGAAAGPQPAPAKKKPPVSAID